MIWRGGGRGLSVELVIYEKNVLQLELTRKCSLRSSSAVYSSRKHIRNRTWHYIMLWYPGLDTSRFLSKMIEKRGLCVVKNLRNLNH